MVNVTSEQATTLFTTSYIPDVEQVVSIPSYWTPHQLNILGIFLWIAIVIALIGNISCFYAVCKNIKKILEHPFFQSNILCILLSAADVLLVLLVGIPAALFFCTANKDDPRHSLLHEQLGNGFYNMAVVEALLDYFVWLQLLLIVTICLDRTGHICRPLTYTFSIKTSGTALACFFCLLLPFVLQTIPYIVMVEKTISQNLDEMTLIGCVPGDYSCMIQKSFSCDDFGHFKELKGNKLYDAAEHPLFLTCTVALPSNRVDGEGRLSEIHKMQWWESVSHPLMLFLAATALVVSNCLIIYKLVQSSRFRRSNMSRPASIKEEGEQVTRMVRLNSTVALIQSVLLVAASLPLRIYQIEEKLHHFYLDKCALEENMDKYYCGFNHRNYHDKYLLVAKMLIFLGPMFNPWLYPIRMASIRTFFTAKKQSLASSARRLTLSSRASTFRLKRSKKNKYVSIATQDTRVADCKLNSNPDQSEHGRFTGSGGREKVEGKSSVLLTLINNGENMTSGLMSNSPNQYSRL